MNTGSKSLTEDFGQSGEGITLALHRALVMLKKSSSKNLSKETKLRSLEDASFTGSTLDLPLRGLVPSLEEPKDQKGCL